jgi:uncharacterized protein
MNKLLLFAVICFVVYLLIKGRGRKQGSSSGQPPAESMVSCARCGLYLPIRESLERDGRRYCCQEHLRADAGDYS